MFNQFSFNFSSTSSVLADTDSSRLSNSVCRLPAGAAGDLGSAPCTAPPSVHSTPLHTSYTPSVQGTCVDNNNVLISDVDAVIEGDVIVDDEDVIASNNNNTVIERIIGQHDSTLLDHDALSAASNNGKLYNLVLK